MIDTNRADALTEAPRVSLGMPVYNAERYLAQAFDSVLAQDYDDYELIVSDNGSTDRTWAICQDYASRDLRIRVHRNEHNLGVAANFNRVVDLARGELFRWVAYDDLLGPNLLSECVAELDRSGPGTVLAFPRTVLIDDDGNVVEEYDDNLDIRAAHPMTRVGMFAYRWNLCNPLYGVIRLDALRRTGLQRPFVSADVPLLLELAAKGEFHQVEQTTFFRRFHVASSSSHPEAWYTPARPSRLRFRSTRLFAQSFAAMATMDSNSAVRWSSAATVAAVWAYRNTRVTLGRYRGELADVLRRRASQRAHLTRPS